MATSTLMSSPLRFAPADCSSVALWLVSEPASKAAIPSSVSASSTAPTPVRWNNIASPKSLNTRRSVRLEPFDAEATSGPSFPLRPPEVSTV